MLAIKDFSVKVGAKNILNGVNLSIKPGEIHAIMGPNGSGKSTLANAIMGHPKYKTTNGKMIFKGKNLTKMPTEKRAKQGLFLAFQYPTEIPGVSLTSLMRHAQKSSFFELRKSLRAHLEDLYLDSKFLDRDMNVGFSGGEKKKTEIVQMEILKPDLAILDEIDSGLDIDALKMIAKVIKNFASKKRSVLLITHYQRILHYLKPDFVHVMINGKIVESGDSKLAKQIEKNGYSCITKRYSL